MTPAEAHNAVMHVRAELRALALKVSRLGYGLEPAEVEAECFALARALEPARVVLSEISRPGLRLMQGGER